MDWLSTNISLARGYMELNPIAHFFIKHGIWTEFLFVKLGLVFGLVGACLALNKHESLARILRVMNIVMAIVVCNNFFWLWWGY